MTGDRHYVERHPDTQKLCFRRDLPGAPIRVPMSKKNNFKPDEMAGRMLDAQKACVAYAAWTQFRKLQPGSKPAKDWIGLHPLEKQKWIEARPDLEGVELRLYRAVMVALENL